MEKKLVSWHDDAGVEEFGVTYGGHATCFVHGRSGIGKTTSIKTLMDAVGKEQVCIFATEMRQYPLLKYKPFILPTPDVPALVTNLAKVEKWIAEKRAPLVCVLDDLTSHCDEMKKAIYAEFPDKAKSFDRWENFADRELELMSRMRDQQMNWIILCQSNPSGGLDGNANPIFQPEVPGNKLPRRLPGLFDEYFFMGEVYKEDSAKWIRYFQTQTVANGTICKDSMGVLDVFEPPDWGAIFGKLTGKPLGGKKSE